MTNKSKQVAVVTGGGNGLGRSISMALARRGCDVLINDIDEAAAYETQSLCRETGASAEVSMRDLTLADAPQHVIDDAVNYLGRLDVLINNAGFAGVESFFEMTPEVWQRTLGVNLTALALTTSAAGRHMRDQKSGRIINITSPGSRMALPNYMAYSASKAGVDSVTRASAVALAPFGVLVNSVSPGMMDTELQRVTEEAMARIDGITDIDAFINERTRRIPLGYRVEPEDVANGIVWLALDAPIYITAERLNFSGGLDKD